MKVLMLGKDTTLLEMEKGVFGDTRKRHIIYASKLRERFPQGSIRIITYTKGCCAKKIDKSEQGLIIYPTNSIHRALYMWGVIRTLPVVLRKWKPDLITTQTPYEEGLLGLVLSRILGEKFIPQLHFNLFSEDWKRENALNGWRRMMACWVIRRADAVRVVSEKQRQDIVEKLGLEEKRIIVSTVGVNFTPDTANKAKSEYKKALKSEYEDKYIVLFVGRFCEQKNLMGWIETAENVIQSRNDVRFVMVGDGALFDGVKKEINKKGVEKYFYLTGKMGHEVLPGIYAAADVFLLTSYYEGLPRVASEAYLSEVPMVCSEESGLRGFVEDGKTGYVNRADDVEGMAEDVLKLVSDEQLRIRMGSEGRKMVQQKYSMDRLADSLISEWERRVSL